ncbi:sulfatase, partial [Candidatus Latescibacterota bacterium]
HGSGSKPGGAVRSGDYKLIEFFEDNHVELYNLKDDIGERNNLADVMSDKRDELYSMLTSWRKNTGALMPIPSE